MKTTPVTSEDIARSVWSVPPLSLDSERRVRADENAKLVRHIEAGGVSTVLWGGNANIYAMTSRLFREMIDGIPDWVSEDAWAIPSAGPDYGKLLEQADILRNTRFPAVMLLPMQAQRDKKGTEKAIRDFVQRSGIPAILYLRAADYLNADQMGSLVEDGVVVALKYAVETGDFTKDPGLEDILKVVPREKIVSGIGEIAAIPHVSTFDLAGFTAGAVCIAPKRAMAVRKAILGGDIAEAKRLVTTIQPLENLRIKHGPIQIIHDAVTHSGVADMGLLTPHMSHVADDVQAEIRAAVAPLLAAEQEFGLVEA